MTTRRIDLLGVDELEDGEMRMVWVDTSDPVLVIRNNGGTAEHVAVSKGSPAGELMEVFGNLHEGDQIVKRASDEIRAGQPIK